MFKKIMGWFGKKAVGKTKEGLLSSEGDFSWKEYLKNKETAKTFEGLEEKLIAADFGGKNVADILTQVKNSGETTYESIREKVRTIVRSKISEFTLEVDENKINVFFVVGVNGVGKTTTIAKLLYYFIDGMGMSENDILLGAADTFRDGAREQLEYWGKGKKVRVLGQKQGSDPSSVCYDVLDAATKGHKKVVIIDTAGRLHNKVNLLDQLQKMDRVFKKFDQNRLKRTSFLVLDANQGLSGYEQVKEFKSKIQLDALILTKMDTFAKAGVLYRVGKDWGIPVSFITFGEKENQIKPFSREEYLSSVLD